ncbi:phospholipid carrier-dependent glycosyltransferase [Geodermatophilus sp. SYSU D00758]
MTRGTANGGTATEVAPPPGRGVGPRHRRPPARGRAALLVLTAVFALAVAARLVGIGHAYELFIDEVTYTDIARSVAAGDGVRLHGEPFHLHPPGLFLTLAGVIGVLGLDTGDLGELTYTLRPVPALFGSITPVLIALLVRRASGSWGAAAAAGALLAMEPFLIRFDSRVLLEAQAMCLATVGLLGLVWLRERERRRRSRQWQPVLVGLVLAGSLLTKETYASVAVLPVLVLLCTGLVLRRRTSGVVLAAVVVAYSLYVVVLGLNGELGDWFEDKTSGVRRLLGLSQITGFNSDSHSAGLVDRILVNLVNFAVTYALIGLGVLAVVWLVVLLRRQTEVPGADRSVLVLVVVWAVCAQLHLSYAVTIGTLEEQMFYLLVVTAVPVVCVVARLLVAGGGPTCPPGLRGRSPRTLAGAFLVGLALALVVDGVVWWRLHAVPDDAYARFLAWAEEELPPGARVVATDETTQFVLDETRVIRLETGAETREFRAQYVLVVSELVEQGYSPVDEELMEIIDEGRLVFSAEGRTVGRLELYDVSAVIGQ